MSVRGLAVGVILAIVTFIVILAATHWPAGAAAFALAVLAGITIAFSDR